MKNLKKKVKKEMSVYRRDLWDVTNKREKQRVAENEVMDDLAIGKIP
jgi:hypothetical protein